VYGLLTLSKRGEGGPRVLTLDTLPERISAKIGEPDGAECWPWLASLRDGYGQIRVGASVRGAHLVIYELLGRTGSERPRPRSPLPQSGLRQPGAP
jgi:hypothetical protein